MCLNRILFLCTVHCFAIVFQSLKASGQANNTNLTFEPPFKVSLGYNDLIANVIPFNKLHVFGNDPNQIWRLLAERMEGDARTPPYSSGGETGTYNIWPLLTLGPWGRPQSPSYLVRFTLTLACQQNDAINRELLIAFSNVFRFMSKQTPRPSYSFSGGVMLSAGKEAKYFFRLFSTSPNVAKSEKMKDIDAGDLATLYNGRETILRNTNSFDLILFLGNTGAYVYHTMNLPWEDIRTKRNAFLIPVTSAFEWTSQRPLDLILNTPEYAMFKRRLLAPAIASKSSDRTSRVIFVDYFHSGHTIFGLRAMFQQSKLWLGPLYLIAVGKPIGAGPPPFPGVTLLDTITVDDNEFLPIIEGGLGRVVPYYPWYYWDAEWQDVGYKDKPLAPGVIRKIRRYESDRLGVGGSTKCPLSTVQRSRRRDYPAGSDDDSHDNITSIPPWPDLGPNTTCVADT